MKNFLNSYKHYFAILFVVISLIASQAIHSVVTKAAASETKITAGDAAASDQFGFTVSISGDYAVIGAYADDDDGNSSGSAYIFERSGDNWSQAAKLTASDAAAEDLFGHSVSISGDYAVISAYTDDDNGTDSGSAYVFEKPGGGWANMTQTAKLTAGDGAASDLFGNSVSISGDYVVIGADYDDDNGSASGSAYIFKKPVSGWVDATQTAKLTASDAAANDNFGNSVSISGDYVVIGSWNDDDAGNSSGSAYIFKKPVSGWVDATQTAKLTASDAEANDFFGRSASISGDYAVIGADYDDDNGSASGSAYVFEKPGGGWVDATQTSKITTSDGAADDYFGYSVSISGDYAVIGANGDDDNGNLSGSAYIYDLTNIHYAFTDANFQQCVDIAVDGTDDDIIDATLVAALAGELNCSSSSISNIAGAQYLTGLTSLDLNTNNISDISTLSALTNLTTLNLASNNISDVSALSALISLTTLNLSSNNISVLSSIGSSNVTLTGFRDNNVINLSDNTFTGVEETALTEIHDYLEATPNPATVTHNINWENCIDSIDNDDDGDTDDADTYCFTTFYIDYDSGGGTACTEALPCASINNLFGLHPNFETLVTTAPVEDVNIYVQGTLNIQDSAEAYINPVTSNIIIQPWGSTPILDGGGISMTGQNTTLEGFEIKNAPAFGVSVTGDGSTIRNNYIHDNGIGIYMGTNIGVGGGGNNISAYNNILINNENAAANVCGGILTAESANNIIINNTLYNNCSTFAFNGTTTFMAGDITLAAIPGMGLLAPSDVLVKQNIVYNDLGTGNTYYYGDGIAINGSTVVGGPLTNQTAADHGTGNNFAETVTDPYVNVAGVTDWSTAGTGCALAVAATYQIGTLDLNTPSTDYLGNPRPSGTGEAGAIENQAGGSSGQEEGPTTDDGTPIVCSPLPTQLDISDTIIMQKDDQSTVTLKWGQAGLHDINPNQKVEIFFDYLKKLPAPVIGLNNIRLENVFTKYIYDEVSESVRSSFYEKLGNFEVDVCSNDISRTLFNAIKEMKNNSEINALIVDFINSLLSLENTIIESSSTAKMDFTNYYYDLFKGGGSAGTVKVVRKVNKGGIFIPDGIAKINSDATSWTDTNIPASDSSEMYKYQIITENCGETKSGNEVEVVIDPVISAGTEVEVILDLKIKIKDAYNNLLMERFRKLFIDENDYEFAYERTCDETKDKLFNTANSDYTLEYLITCFGEEDERLMREIASREMYIVPPLIRLINHGLTQSEINSKIQQIVDDIKKKIIFNETVQEYVENEQLPVGDFVNELDINNLSASEMEIMKLLDKDYFEGVSHSANIVIEKYDANDNLLETFNTGTDIFGNTVIRIGKFVSGDDYTLKIKLCDERFVLPKVVTMQINNAVKEVRPFGTVYTANVDLEFDRSFRYGDFNEDGEINLSDIGEWGKLLKGEVAGDYQLWELWEFANLDGLEGIDLLDVITLQENWGGLKEFRVEDSEMTLREIFELFGISITSDPTLDAMVKVAGWLDLVGTDC